MRVRAHSRAFFCVCMCTGALCVRARLFARASDLQELDGELEDGHHVEVGVDHLRAGAPAAIVSTRSRLWPVITSGRSLSDRARYEGRRVLRS
jgi:hypothetical protein